MNLDLINAIRSDYIALAREKEGLSAHPIHGDEWMFGSLCCPAGPEWARRFFCARTPNPPVNSSCVAVACGLVVEALRERGLPQLPQPFDDAVHVLGRTAALARVHGALCTPETHPEGPGPACAVLVEGQSRVHMYTVVERDGERVVSIDGGQIDGGYQCVRTIHRIIRGAFDVTSGKPIVYWVDVPRLIASLLELRTSVPPPPPPEPVKTDSSGSLIVDLSSNNGHVDSFVEMRVAGVAGVYLRALIGRDDEDKMLRVHAAACRDAGMPFGLYGDCFPRHARPQDADVQARQLVALHRELGATLPLMIDVEPEGDATAAVTGPEWDAAVEQYIAGIERGLGVRPLVYVGSWFLATFPELAHDCALARCPLWLPAYLDAMPAPPRPWTRIACWQHHGGGPTIAPRFRGHVAGVRGDVDLSTWFGTLDELRVP